MGAGWKEGLNATSVLGWGVGGLGGGGRVCECSCMCVMMGVQVSGKLGGLGAGGGGDKWNVSEIVPTWNDHARLCLHVVLFPGPLGEFLVS